MADDEQAFPLCWPSGWKRCADRKRAVFMTTLDRARRDLVRELEMDSFGATRIIISTNLPLRKDGAPYATSRTTDPGVAVYFERKGKRLSFACDKWDRIEDNMQAIKHSISALRGLERWGASDMLDRAFTGFTALPAPENQEDWAVVFGVHRSTPIEQLETVYRALMKTAHPDMPTGSHTRAHRLNAAIAAARREKGVSP